MASLLKTIVGGIAGFALGGPLGAAAGAASTFLKPKAITAGFSAAPALIGGTIAAAGTSLAKRFTMKQRRAILGLSREIGIAGTATALALSVTDVAEVVSAGTRRRRRGITASSLATTKRTIRQLNSMNDQVQKIAKTRTVRRKAC